MLEREMNKILNNLEKHGSTVALTLLVVGISTGLAIAIALPDKVKVSPEEIRHQELIQAVKTDNVVIRLIQPKYNYF